MSRLRRPPLRLGTILLLCSVGLAPGPLLAAHAPKSEKPAKAEPTTPAEPASPPETPAPDDTEQEYWLTVDAMGVRTRHVHKCRFFGNLKGRPCTKKEGRACRECGG